MIIGARSGACTRRWEIEVCGSITGIPQEELPIMKFRRAEIPDRVAREDLHADVTGSYLVYEAGRRLALMWTISCRRLRRLPHVSVH